VRDSGPNYVYYRFITKLSLAPRDADFDSDGDVDLRDVAAYQNCFEGQNADTCGTGCDEFDLVTDHSLDVHDYTLLLDRLTGP